MASTRAGLALCPTGQSTKAIQEKAHFLMVPLPLPLGLSVQATLRRRRHVGNVAGAASFIPTRSLHADNAIACRARSSQHHLPSARIRTLVVGSMQKRRALQDALPPPPRLPQNPDASSKTIVSRYEALSVSQTDADVVPLPNKSSP